MTPFHINAEESLVWDTSAEDLPADAVHAILEHGALPHAKCIVENVRVNRFSTTTFVTVRNADASRSYVLKRPRNCARQQSWSPRREFENTRQLRDLSHGSTILHVAEPVAFSEDPPFLVTRFIPGTSLETVVKPGCRRFATAARRAAAVHACRLLGEWVGEKLRLTARPTRPMALEDYRNFCEERLLEVTDFYGNAGKRVSISVSRWLDRLGAAGYLGDCFPITNEYARQFDCTPQNFILSLDQQLWGIDFDSLRYTHLLVDPCAFKLWLEHMLTNVSYSRSSIRSCWSAFACQGARPHGLVLLSYVHTVLADLVWRRNPERLGVARQGPLAGLRQRLLTGYMFATLRKLAAQDPTDGAGVREWLEI